MAMHRLVSSSNRRIHILSYSSSTMRVRRHSPGAMMMMMASSTWGFQQQHLSIIPNSRNLSSFPKRWNARNQQHSSLSSKMRQSYNDDADCDDSMFKTGDAIQVEVIQFGPMGASVDVVGLGHDPKNLLDESEPALGEGLILQREIGYFRQARDNLDVVQGEVLPAYVEKVREEDGKLNIALRQIGGKAKAESVGKMIVDELQANGSLAVGDKSSPADINHVFPGVSKGAFKKAVSALYKKGIVKPGPYSIELQSK